MKKELENQQNLERIKMDKLEQTRPCKLSISSMIATAKNQSGQSKMLAAKMGKMNVTLPSSKPSN